MAKVFEQIDEPIQQFIEAQHLFFVATAPLSAEGHVNVSPKGMDCLRILTPNRVVYLDLIGSGNETSAHLYENGRVTFMFCAFEGPPNIVRLYGTGHTIRPGDGEWAALLPLFPDYPNVRQIIAADIHRVQTSCGYGVPLMAFVADRDTMARWAEAKGEDGLIAYQCEKNAASIDGLPTPIGLEVSENNG